MKVDKQIVFSLAAILLLASIAIADEYLWDQTNFLIKPGSCRNIENFAPIGQEFTPNLGSLEVVQFEVHNYEEYPAELSVNIYSDSITGCLIGSSNTTVLPGNFDGTATFLFDTLHLQPLHVYIMELVLTLGAAGVYGPSGSTYPEGCAILFGMPYGVIDLWFREGVLEGTALERFTWGSVKSHSW